jgi:spermidine synthase
MDSVSKINSDGYYEEKAPLQRSSTKYQIEACYVSEQTDYSHTVIARSPDYGMMLFLDGELQSSSYDEAIYHETLVHPIMNVFASLNDKRVLVVGGAEGATVREVLKWSSVALVDWVDIDNKLVELCRTYLKYCPLEVYNDTRVIRYTNDIMKYIDMVEKSTYDIIIIDLPDPDPEMPNPLYGEEFWAKIKGALKSEGGIVTHTGPVEPGLGRQVGLKMVQEGYGATGFPYHTCIPSFQGDWGFWMNKAPESKSDFPYMCSVMTGDYQHTIFHWDKHWQI